MSKQPFKITKPNFSKRHFFVPLVFAVFFSLFYLVYSDVKERTINEFDKEQLMLAQTASEGITSFFNEYQANLTFLSHITDIIDVTDEGKILMANFYNNRKNNIEAITRVDSLGTIQYTYPYNKHALGENISGQEHFRQVMTTHQPVVSDVFMSVQGYMAIAIHVPVFKEKKFNGSVAVLISIDKLGKQYLGKIKIRGTGNVWLLSEKGIEIYCPLQTHTGKSFLDITRHDPASASLLEKIKTTKTGKAKGIHKEYSNNGKTLFHENQMVFYRSPLGNTYWTILISYHDEDIFISLFKLRNRLILIFVFLFLVISYYFYSLVKVRNVLKEEEKRKNAEKILRESEQKFKAIFNQSPIGIELYNADGLQTNANKASLAIFKIPDESEILEFNLFDGTSLDDDKKERLRKGEVITYQAVFDFEKVKALKQYKTDRSGKAILDYIITPLLHSEKKVIYGYLLQVQDITERKRAEEEILMLAHALRSVNECVTITDMEDKILFLNESFSKTYGYTENELIGMNIGIIRSGINSPGKISEILPGTLKGGWKGELMNTRKNGSEFPVFLSTTVIRDKNGNALGLIGVASDITENKRKEHELISAKEKAEESDRLKSAFLANMSHEIRTPMNGILGFSELLKTPGLSGDQQQQYISIIEKSGKRMLNIINDIIDISKIEAGLVNVTVSELNITELLDFQFTFFKPEAERKNIRLTCRNKIISKDFIVLTDKVKVNAILTNLIKNAIKYTPAGTIEFGYGIRAENESPEIEFFVKDTGIGIARDRHLAIFERFIQADIDDKLAFQGAGLGLSISKAYVEMLGGKIWVESEEGKGSAFYFTLPFKPATALKENDEQTSGYENDSETDKKLKILLVEDDDTSKMLISLIVEKISKEIISVTSGVEAVEACRNNPDLDLVLMDIKIPDMDGYKATRLIREFNKTVVIIAQTAYGLSGDKENAMVAGCNDYISKPIKQAELMELIQKHIKMVGLEI